MASDLDLSSRSILGRLDAAASAASSSSAACFSPLAAKLARLSPLFFLLLLLCLRFFEPPLALPATLVESSASLEAWLARSFCTLATAAAGAVDDAAGAMSFCRVSRGCSSAGDRGAYPGLFRGVLGSGWLNRRRSCVPESFQLFMISERRKEEISGISLELRLFEWPSRWCTSPYYPRGSRGPLPAKPL